MNNDRIVPICKQYNVSIKWKIYTHAYKVFCNFAFVYNYK